jgi:hypothetical protein
MTSYMLSADIILLLQENMLNKKFRKANRNRGDYTLLDFGSHDSSSGRVFGGKSFGGKSHTSTYHGTSPGASGDGTGSVKRKTRRFFRFSK